MEKQKRKEIDIIGLLKVLIKNWKYLMRYAAAGAVGGIIAAFSIPKVFSSSVILAPEFSSGATLSGSLSDLASSFGVNLSGNKSAMDAIYPDLYPDIFESTKFIESLYDVPVRLQKDNTPRKYIDHLIKEVKIPWWNYPRVWLAELLKPSEPLNPSGKGAPDPYAMNRTQWDVYKEVMSAVNCQVDKKTSVITLSVTDQDPMVAAIMADTLQHHLQEYIIDYRTSKARTDVEYYRRLAEEAKQDYENIRKRYVRSSDSNLNATLMAVTAQTEDLENDMQLKYNVYTQSMAQLKAAEAKLQEKTPAFTVIQPARVNPKPVSTPKIVIMFMWIVFACFAGSVVVLWKEYKGKIISFLG